MSRSVFQQFTPLLHELNAAIGFAVVVATVAGRPSSHSSWVPECVKPAAPDSKSVVKTVVVVKPAAQVGGGGGSQMRSAHDVSVPPLAPAVSSRRSRVQVPPASWPSNQERRYAPDVLAVPAVELFSGL